MRPTDDVTIGDAYQPASRVDGELREAARDVIRYELELALARDIEATADADNRARGAIGELEVRRLGERV